jgi:hypothetical protein
MKRRNLINVSSDGGQCRLRHSAGQGGLTGRSLFRTNHRHNFGSIQARRIAND